MYDPVKVETVGELLVTDADPTNLYCAVYRCGLCGKRLVQTKYPERFEDEIELQKATAQIIRNDDVDPATTTKDVVGEKPSRMYLLHSNKTHCGVASFCGYAKVMRKDQFRGDG